MHGAMSKTTIPAGAPAAIRLVLPGVMAAA